MKILWISSLAWKFDHGYEYNIKQSGAVSGSLFQQSIIEGLEMISDVNIDIICDYPSDTGKKKIYPWKHRKNGDDICVGSNCRIVNKGLKIIKAMKLKKSFQYDIVCAYLVHTPYLLGLAYAKKKIKIVRLFLLCQIYQNLWICH